MKEYIILSEGHDQRKDLLKDPDLPKYLKTDVILEVDQDRVIGQRKNPRDVIVTVLGQKRKSHVVMALSHLPPGVKDQPQEMIGDLKGQDRGLKKGRDIEEGTHQHPLRHLHIAMQVEVVIMVKEIEENQRSQALEKQGEGLDLNKSICTNMI